MKTKLFELAQSLIEKTNNQEIKWEEEDNVVETEYSAKLGMSSVTIISSIDNFTSAPSLVCKIINKKKQVAGQMSALRGEPDYRILQSLFDSAMASSKDLYETLDEIQIFLKKT